VNEKRGRGRGESGERTDGKRARETAGVFVNSRATTPAEGAIATTPQTHRQQKQQGNSAALSLWNKK